MFSSQFLACWHCYHLQMVLGLISLFTTLRQPIIFSLLICAQLIITTGCKLCDEDCTATLSSAEVRWGVIGFPLREVSAGAKTERSITFSLDSLRTKNPLSLCGEDRHKATLYVYDLVFFSSRPAFKKWSLVMMHCYHFRCYIVVIGLSGVQFGLLSYE